MVKPTEKQASILSFISRYAQSTGYPPTIREIADEFGLASTKSVKTQLDALKKKGLLRRKGRGARAIEVIGIRRGNAKTVPVVGRIPAGLPSLAIEDVEREVLLDRSMVPTEGCFLLRVRGESMVEESILDGDYALVKPQPVAENGDTVVAMLDGEATLKRFYKEGDRIILKPANKNMKPIVIERGEVAEFKIVGKVVAVLRFFEGPNPAKVSRGD
ncbi:repressor LexA [candidate division TA06 bacterium]|uniref:LexA repressor n=1 Tax=candidate division TA06 bacterium TaxID=2250710 RepID=A0A523XS16_UNCT6|nr:MAG: repressor LexA [candidate division TA06 bacterium]